MSRIPSWADEAVDVLLVLVLARRPSLRHGVAIRRRAGAGSRRRATPRPPPRRIESTRASTTADQQTIVDVMTFTNYVNAWRSGDTELADFYHTAFERSSYLPSTLGWRPIP